MGVKLYCAVGDSVDLPVDIVEFLRKHRGDAGFYIENDAIQPQFNITVRSI